MYGSFEHEEITGRYNDFAKQIEALQEGKLPLEDFARWFYSTRDVMNRSRKDFVKLIRGLEFEDVDLTRVQTLEDLEAITVQKTDYFKSREEEVTTAVEGMLDYEAGMELIAQFLEQESEGHQALHEALQRMWDGNQKCNLALKMNRAYREELAAEFS